MSDDLLSEEEVRILIGSNIKSLKYVNCPLSTEELFQIGWVGYLKAVKNFNEAKKEYFSKGAYWAIREELVKELKREYKHKIDRHDKFVNMDTEAFELTLNRLGGVISYEDGHESKLTLNNLRKAINKLDSRQAQILTSIYLNGENLTSLGEYYGVSHQRIGQLHKQALKNLKEVLKDERREDI